MTSGVLAPSGAAASIHAAAARAAPEVLESLGVDPSLGLGPGEVEQRRITTARTRSRPTTRASSRPVAPAALPAAGPAAGRRDRVVLRRRGQRRRHHRGDRRRVGRARVSSTSTGPSGPRRRCTRRSATTSPSSATAGRSASRSPTWCPATSSHLRLGDDRPGRHPAARRERPRVRRVDPDRRVGAGRRSPPTPVPTGAPLAELSSCVFMGTVVHAAAAAASWSPPGARTEFGRIAVGLGEPPARDRVPARPRPLLGAAGQGRRRADRHDLRRSTSLLHRPVIDACCSRWRSRSASPRSCCPRSCRTSLATGSRRLAATKVLVKRLVCIEDLGDIDVLFTDKTGTLTDGHISFDARRSPPTAATATTCSRSACCATRPTSTGGTRGRRQPARRRPVGVARRDGTARAGELPPGRHRCRSTTTAGWSPCSSDRDGAATARHQGRARGGPRPLRRRRRRRAPTRSTPSSPPATGWSPSPPGPPPSRTALDRRRRART